MDRRPSAPASNVGLPDVSDAPHWHPSPAELDDVELALAGVDLPVAVEVPISLAASLGSTPGLVLTADVSVFDGVEQVVELLARGGYVVPSAPVGSGYDQPSTGGADGMVG